MALLAAWLTMALTTRLDRVPGLHGDEAWFGLRAWQIAIGRSTSIHAMHGYTGVVYPYLVSLVFRAFGPSTLALRSVGVTFNLASLAVLAATCVRVGRNGGRIVIFLLLASASLLVTSESRIAWEVVALNPLLASALLFTCAIWVQNEQGLAGAPLALSCISLLSLSALGTFSHFIFVVFAIGLAATSLACALRYRTVSAAQLVITQGVALANLVVLTCAKLWLYKHDVSSPRALGVFGIFLAAEALLLPKLLSRPAACSRVLQFLARRADVIRWLLCGYFVVGGIAFAIVHSVAFVQTLANDVLVKRLYSVSMPLPLLLLSYVYVGVLVLLYGRTLLAAVRGLEFASSEYFVLVLPVAIAVVLPFFVFANGIRHYVLIATVFLIAVWVSWSRLEGRARPVVTSALAVYAVLLNALVASIVLSPEHYQNATPLHFDLGHAVETSAHFLPLDRVFERTKADHVETLRTSDPFFIRGPLEFYALSGGGKPIHGTTATVNYDYGRPGGLTYDLTRANMHPTE